MRTGVPPAIANLDELVEAKVIREEPRRAAVPAVVVAKKFLLFKEFFFIPATFLLGLGKSNIVIVCD